MLNYRVASGFCTGGVWAAGVAMLAGAGGLHAADVATPIGLTGWNQDVVVENTQTDDTAGVAASTTTNVVGFDWYQQGLPNTSQGLPAGRSFTSAFTNTVTGTNTNFQYQPYTANNVVDNAGTVSLVTPGKYASLAILNSAQGANGDTFSATLNFADATHTQTVLTGSDVDWTYNGPNAISNIGLVTTSGGVYSGALNMFEHDFALSEADQAKTLLSIDWAVTSGSEEQLFAVSGVAATPEPASLGLLGLAGLGLLARRRR